MDDIRSLIDEVFDPLEPDSIKTEMIPGPAQCGPGAAHTTHSDNSVAEENLVYAMCQECGKAYGRQDVLRNHVRTKHGSSGTEDSLI